MVTMDRAVLILNAGPQSDERERDGGRAFFSEFRMGRWRQGEIEEEQPCFWNELDAGSSTQILQINPRFSFYVIDNSCCY